MSKAVGRVVLDTNLVLSALVFQSSSYPYEIYGKRDESILLSLGKLLQS